MDSGNKVRTVLRVFEEVTYVEVNEVVLVVFCKKGADDQLCI